MNQWPFFDAFEDISPPPPPEISSSSFLTFSKITTRASYSGKYGVQKRVVCRGTNVDTLWRCV